MYCLLCLFVVCVCVCVWLSGDKIARDRGLNPKAGGEDGEQNPISAFLQITTQYIIELFGTIRYPVTIH